MDLFSLYNEYGIVTIILLTLSAFTAGFIDAVVGGGGLIQTPFCLLHSQNAIACFIWNQ